MKSEKIYTFFVLVTFIIALVLGISFYFFTNKKNLAINETLNSYRINSSKLIADKVYEDLIIENQLEVNRKLNLLKENKIISKYKVVKGETYLNNDYENCEKIYFDKFNPGIAWGELCLSFTDDFNKQKVINLQGLSYIVSILIFSIVLFVILFFKTISVANNQLYLGINTVLNNPNEIKFENSFWGPVLIELRKLVLINKSSEEKLINQKIEVEKIELANQVSHDIRSPLAVLENLDFTTTKNNSKELKLAKEAIGRLVKISNSLLDNNRLNKIEVKNTGEIHEAITNILEGKSIEFPNRRILKDFTPAEVCTYIEIEKFESILSNLINNALEATLENDSVIVKTVFNFEYFSILISDNGKGISPEILKQLGEKQLSFDKVNGNGLGVYFASKVVKSWGGEFKIQSELGRGTTITILLPLVVKNNKILSVLLDNDELIRLTWEIKAKKNNIDLLTFKSSEELLSSLDKFTKDTIFYIDSDLDSEKGEVIAEKLFHLGFSNLIMSSGYSELKFANLKFITKTIGKSPPF